MSLGTTTRPGEIEILNPYGRISITKTSSEERKDILGHPFYKDQIEIGLIYADSILVDKRPIKYNALKDEVEVYQDSSIFYLSRNDKFKIKVNKEEGYYYQLKEYNDQNLYFIFFNEGTHSLALRMSKRITLGQEAETNYDRSTPPKYVKYQDLFIINNDTNKVYPIKLKKKFILNILQDKKEKITEYVSDKKLRYKKEKDVIKILKYYDSL